jgi:putative ABC transport system ATP-binding protein
MGRVQVEALRGIDLHIKRGEYAAILGPSGSGKSTLMHILGCLDTPTTGHYRLDGSPVEKLKRNELAQVRSEKIGFVFQSFNLLAHATAEGNVELPLIYNGTRRRQRRQRAAELLERVGLGHRREHKPSELSGGQRQRVALATPLLAKKSSPSLRN